MPGGKGDPGLQFERTTLAWSRTCLSYVGCSLLCAKLAARAAPLAACVGLAGTAAAMVVLGLALRRYRGEPGEHAGEWTTRVVPVALVVTLTAMTVGLGAVVVALVVVAG